MSFHRVLLGLTIFFTGSLSLATTQEAQGRDVAFKLRIVKDQSYRPHGSTDDEQTQCQLDLYLPENTSGFPVLVWFHSGSLTGGKKTSGVAGTLGRRFVTQEGIAVVSVDYRLSPHVTYPTYIEDCAVAVAWVSRHIADYGGDPRKIFVGGFSAGGYLTAMLAADQKYLAEQALPPRSVRGFIPISGQLDVHSTVRLERGIHHVLKVLDEAAPLFHVRPSVPPQLVIIGEEESKHRMKMNRRYVTELKAAGDTDIQYVVVPKRNHDTIMWHLKEQDDLVATSMLAFVRSHLPPTLVPKKIGQIAPMHVCGDFLLASQPQPDDFKILRQRGVKTVLSVRGAEEVSWDEAAMARKLGMEFIRVPFRNPDELTSDVFEKLLKVLRSKPKGLTLFHCGSANRVGAIWYVKRVLDDGLSPKEALAEAKQVGLRTPGYVDKARAYVEQVRKAESRKSPPP